jgi:glutamate formiminotransferase/formiminotetrahydrofolate cyclodeaminase
MAADYYIQKENLFIIDENQKIRLAIERMGLNSISNFDPNKRIIEYLIKEEPNEPLASMTLRGFIEEVGARTAAPGGGSVSAAIASMGVALANMVAKLTYGVRKFEHLDGKMREIIPNFDSTFRELIAKIDEDTNAFNDYIAAIRLPQNTDEEKHIRENEMQNGLKKAINTPLSVMRLSSSIWYEFEEAAKVTNYASKSDLEVGVKALETGIWGAYRNVMINMKDITDQEYINSVTQEAKTIYENAVQKTKTILEILDNRVD